MLRPVAAIAAAASIAGCSGSHAPLSAEERAGLEGRIYFVADTDGRSKAMAVRPDGSGLVQLLPGDRRADFPSGASPDGRWVAIVRGDEGAHDVLVVRPDGTDPRPITAAAGVDWHPAFSPNGAWLLFESQRDGFRDLYKVRVGSDEIVRLTDDPEGNFDGAWSPDGTRIAFASSRHGQLDLFCMNADGSDQRRLTFHPGDSIKPAWSSDGSRIAFISGRDGSDALFAIRADGSGLSKLGQATPVAERFAWRPDGRAIAYVAIDRDSKRKIHLVELESGADVARSSQQDDDYDPAWSPDGAHLAFASEEVRGQPMIELMRADGTRRTRLTELRGAWLPRWLRVKD